MKRESRVRARNTGKWLRIIGYLQLSINRREPSDLLGHESDRALIAECGRSASFDRSRPIAFGADAVEDGGCSLSL